MFLSIIFVLCLRQFFILGPEISNPYMYEWISLRGSRKEAVNTPNIKRIIFIRSAWSFSSNVVARFDSIGVPTIY